MIFALYSFHKFSSLQNFITQYTYFISVTYHLLCVFNYSDLTVVAFGEYVLKLPILNALTQFMIQILCYVY